MPVRFAFEKSMSESPLVSEPAAPTAEKKRGCFRSVLLGCGTFLMLGILGLGLCLWPFIERRHRADRFGAYVKVGQSMTEVFGGPREWNVIHIECGPAGRATRRLDVRQRSDHYEVADGLRGGVPESYPNFDALVKDLVAGAGPFAGVREIGLVYSFLEQSRTYDLTLSPDGRVAKIERFSRD